MTFEEMPLIAFWLLFGGLILILPLQAPFPGFGEPYLAGFSLMLPGVAAGIWAGCSGLVQCRDRITVVAVLNILSGIISLGYLVALGIFHLR